MIHPWVCLLCRMKYYAFESKHLSEHDCASNRKNVMKTMLYSFNVHRSSSAVDDTSTMIISDIDTTNTVTPIPSPTHSTIPPSSMLMIGPADTSHKCPSGIPVQSSATVNDVNMRVEG